MVMAPGLLVVGAGRTGTSVAARLASRIGLRLPHGSDLMPATAANPQGYWESLSLAKFNDRLLNRWSSSWWQPPLSVTETMVADLEDLRDEAERKFVASFGHEPGWVWKDPRLTVLLPFWERVLGRHAALLPYRQPQAVARSIAFRDDLAYEQGLAIWERHTRLVLTSLAGRRVAVTSYERLRDDPLRWQTDLLGFCRAAGLPVSEPSDAARDEVTEPRSPSNGALSTQQQALQDLLLGCEGFHAEFPSLDLPEETPGVDDVLRGIEVPLYVRHGRLVAQHDQLTARHERLRSRHDHLRAEHAELRAQLNNLGAKHATLDMEHALLRQQYEVVTSSRAFRLSAGFGRVRLRIRTVARSLLRRTGDATVRTVDARGD